MPENKLLQALQDTTVTEQKTVGNSLLNALEIDKSILYKKPQLETKDVMRGEIPNEVVNQKIKDVAKDSFLERTGKRTLQGILGAMGSFGVAYPGHAARKAAGIKTEFDVAQEALKPETTGKAWQDVVADIIGMTPEFMMAGGISKGVMKNISNTVLRRGGRGALTSMIIDIMENKNISPKQAIEFAGIDIVTGFGSDVFKAVKQVKGLTTKIDNIIPKEPAKTKTFQQITKAEQRQQISKAEQLRRTLETGKIVKGEKKQIPEKVGKPMPERMPKAAIPEESEKTVYERTTQELEQAFFKRELPVKREGKAIPMPAKGKTPRFVGYKSKEIEKEVVKERISKTNWQKAVIEAEEKVGKIGETFRSAALGTNVDAMRKSVKSVAKKYNVPESTLRKQVLWEVRDKIKPEIRKSPEEWYKQYVETYIKPAKARVKPKGKKTDLAKSEFTDVYNATDTEFAKIKENWIKETGDNTVKNYTRKEFGQRTGVEVFNKKTGKPADDIITIKYYTKAKEPWEMTKTEWHLEKIVPTQKYERTTAIRRSNFKKRKRLIEEHKSTIRKALTEGKSVPEKVLKGYPELKKFKKPLEPKAQMKEQSGGVTLWGGIPLKQIGNALDKIGEPYRKYFADPLIKKLETNWHQLKKKTIPEKLQSEFITPQSQEYKSLKYKLKGEYAERFEDIERIYRQLTTGLTEAEKLRVGQIIKGSITNDPRLKRLAEPAKKMFQELRGELRETTGKLKDVYTDKLTKKQLNQLFNKIQINRNRINRIKSKRVVGELSNAKQKEIRKLNAEIESAQKRVRTHYKYGGTDYMPRMYISKEEQTFRNRWNLWPKKRKRMDLRYTYERENIPFEIRKQMEEMHEPAYPVATGLGREAKDLQLGKLFDTVSKNKEWTKEVSELSKLDGELFIDSAGKEFLKMPTSKKLGRLSEKYVTREIADDVNEVIRVQEEAERLTSKLVSQWKGFKVLWNPATQARNTRSNAMLADFNGGLSPVWDLDIYLSTFRGYLSKGKNYKEALKEGLMGTTWYGSEIKPFAEEFMKQEGNALQRITSIFPKFQNKLGKFYQANEQYFKLAVFTKQRSLGKSTKEAADIARSALFDYSDVPKFINKLRTKWYGMPFITFPYKALPQTAKSLVRRPLRTLKWFMVPPLIEESARRTLGLSVDDLHKIREVLPEWMQNGFYTLMPWTQKDETGRDKYIFYDFTFDLPWGDIGESGKGLGKLTPEIGGYPTIPRGFQPFQNPLFTIPAMYGMNKNPLTGEDIYKSTDTLMERWNKVIPHAYKQIVPSPFGYSGEKMVEALKGKRGLGTTAMHTLLGMKFREIKPEELKTSKQIGLYKEIKDLNLEIGRAQRRFSQGYISKEKLENIRKRTLEKITKRQKELNKITKE